MCNCDDSSPYLVHVLDWRLALREGLESRESWGNRRTNLWRTAKDHEDFTKLKEGSTHHGLGALYLASF